MKGREKECGRGREERRGEYEIWIPTIGTD